jgi:hypothetical protein
MHGRGPGNSSPRAKMAATASGNAEAKIPKRNMTLYSLHPSPAARGLWLAERKEN